MDRTSYPSALATLTLVPFDSLRLDKLITIGGVLPMSLTVEHTPIKEADTFSLKLSERYFPTDPRLFKMVAVAGYMGDSGAVDRLIPNSDEYLSILGHASKVKKGFDDGASVEIEGADYKAVMIEQTWQGRSVALGAPLAEIVAEVLSTMPALADLIVETENGFDPIVPAPSKGKKGKVYRASSNTPVFQALLEIAMGVGASITVRGDRVIVGRPRTLDERAEAVPYFITAENLKSLSIQRNFGVADLPNIRVTAYDTVSGVTLTGQYPRELRKTSRTTRASGKVKRTDSSNINSFQVFLQAPTQAQVDAIAQRVFEKYAQQQVEVSFSTDDMSVREFFVGQGRQAEASVTDVTRLRNGSPVRLLISPETRNVLNRPISQDQARRELIALEFEREVAEVLARGWREVDTTFFIDRATHSYDDGEYEFSAEASAFLTVSEEDLT